jgi:hypothetical protein
VDKYGIVASFITSYPLRAGQSTSRTLEPLDFYNLFRQVPFLPGVGGQETVDANHRQEQLKRK